MTEKEVEQKIEEVFSAGVKKGFELACDGLFNIFKTFKSEVIGIAKIRERDGKISYKTNKG